PTPATSASAAADADENEVLGTFLSAAIRDAHRAIAMSHREAVPRESAAVGPGGVASAAAMADDFDRLSGSDSDATDNAADEKQRKADDAARKTAAAAAAAGGSSE